MDYSDVIGQEDIRQRLRQMADEGRVPHAIMFCGAPGSGKMALALAFATQLLGDNAMTRKFVHPDLHFSYPVIRPTGTPSERKIVSDDFATEWHAMLMQSPYFTLDQWLEQMKAANQQAVIYEAESDALTRKLSLKSSQGGYKVSLIWLPERMNTVCANKLLKLLEEPPQQTVFLLVCQQPEQLLETIRSRVQRIDVKKIDTAAIEQALQQRRGIEADTAHRIARVANGSWIKALEELDAGNENHLFLDLFIMLMRLAYMRNIRDLKKWSENVAAMGREKQRRLLAYFQRMVRENFVYNFRNPDLVYMTGDEEHFAKNFARFINEKNVIEIAELLQGADRQIAQNGSAKIVFFDVALQTIILLLRK